MKDSVKETQLLTLEEAQAYLKVSKTQLYRFIDADNGGLPVIHVSERAPRIRLKDLKKWVKSKEVKNNFNR